MFLVLFILSGLSVLSYSDFSVLFLIHLIVLHHYFLEVCFLRRDRKGADPDRRGGREKLGGVKEGETVIRIFLQEKSRFSKRK